MKTYDVSGRDVVVAMQARESVRVHRRLRTMVYLSAAGVVFLAVLWAVW